MYCADGVRRDVDVRETRKRDRSGDGWMRRTWTRKCEREVNDHEAKDGGQEVGGHGDDAEMDKLEQRRGQIQDAEERQLRGATMWHREALGRTWARRRHCRQGP
jgi:hypothetical protein